MITLETSLFSTAETVINARIVWIDHIFRKYKPDKNLHCINYNDFNIISSLLELRSRLKSIQCCLHYFVGTSDSVNLGGEIIDIDEAMFDTLAQSSFSDNNFLEKTDKEISRLELGICGINAESSSKFAQTPYIKEKEDYEK